MPKALIRPTITVDMRQGNILEADQAVSVLLRPLDISSMRFTALCLPQKAKRRWSQLLAAQPGQTITVEWQAGFQADLMVQLTRLDISSPVHTRRFAVHALTPDEQQDAALHTVAEQVMALVSNLVLFLDAENCITYVSRSVTQYLGYEALALLGQSIFHLFDETQGRQLQQQLRSPQVQPHQTYPIQHHDGSVRLLEVTWSDLLDDPLVKSVIVVARDVTDTSQVQALLSSQHAFYEAILEDLPTQVAVLDARGRYLYVNPAAIRNPQIRTGILGLTDEEYCQWRGHDPAIAQQRRTHFQAAAQSRSKVSWSEVMYDKAGHSQYHQRHYLPTFDSSGELTRMIGYGQDETPRQRQLELQIRQTRILALSTQNAPLSDVLGEVQAALEHHYPQSYAELSLGGSAPAEVNVLGNHWIALQGEQGHPVGGLYLQGVFEPPQEVQRVLAYLAQVAGLVIERAQSLARLKRLAYEDPLTGLPNRAALSQKLTDHIALGRPWTVVVLNLARFRQINDRYGYLVGDEVLRQVAQRLLACLPPAGSAARLGSNTFALLLPLVTTASTLEALTSSLAQPLLVQQHALYVDIHVGVRPWLSGFSTAETLLQQAEHTMRRAQHLGQSVSHYDAQTYVVELTQDALETELHQAVEAQQLTLAFQPLVHPQTRRLHSMEVLLRWDHPQRGMISPSVFIVLAEQSSLILRLGRWVLHQACLEAARWPGGPLRINVNVSAHQVEQAEFAQEVEEILQLTGLPSGYLELEITEGVLMRANRTVTNVLNQLHALGVRLALDDYGTGYANLAYLKRFPLDVLKIDRSFVQGLGADVADQRDLAIVRSTIALAHELGLSVVAEGIERAEQLSLIAALGCDLAQGYLFSAALPLPQAQEWAIQGPDSPEL
ncbi:EAL domain-containing protein [Deinococcus sp. QL22]|uniref:sensor domain-containing protein n=1 Tax=Deinococcus sp. QL22 TaxID=2939437 RepID=UPI00201720B8|nr:EAL domain-containing protein [Deinococcus sp. QL22]UQN08466.1 EAL domain-containing protein [Deinococcus sp. QL22]